jgi:hypothetical protein
MTEEPPVPIELSALKNQLRDVKISSKGLPSKLLLQPDSKLFFAFFKSS